MWLKYLLYCVSPRLTSFHLNKITVAWFQTDLFRPDLLNSDSIMPTKFGSTATTKILVIKKSNSCLWKVARIENVNKIHITPNFFFHSHWMYRNCDVIENEAKSSTYKIFQRNRIELEIFHSKESYCFENVISRKVILQQNRLSRILIWMSFWRFIFLEKKQTQTYVLIDFLQTYGWGRKMTMMFTFDNVTKNQNTNIELDFLKFSTCSE